MPPETEDAVIEIPSDVIALGHDADGLPKTVLVEGEPKAEPEVKAKPEPPKVDPDLEVTKRRFRESQDRLAAMSADLERERAARTKSEESALEDRTFAWRTHMSNLQKDKQLIESGLASVTDAQAFAERELQAAEEAGDIARKIAATKALTTATSRIEEYQRGKAGIDAEIARNKDPYEQFEAAATQRKVPKEETKVEDRPKPTTPEDFIATAPKAMQDWLRDHKEFATLGSKQSKKLDVLAADWLIDHDGDRASLDTEAFRRAADAKFFPDGSEEPTYVAEKEEAPEPAPKAAVRSRAVAAAPVSRGDDLFSSRNLNAKGGKLPPKLAAIVKASGMDATKYFHETVALIKKGELPKNFLDSDYPHDY